MKQPDYIIDEIALTKGIIDLGYILSLQIHHDIQVIRGEDYQYCCYIDKECWATGLTPLWALAYGAKLFREKDDK